ncbi:DUF2777 family protein [Alkalicoccus chagannorensis]|uniref:DUF2777 family protein n=1 Tax=Alkalicoccus chagannorensis TaxID=427072 RepID=UPI0003FC902C|nr:DUF2777 family protein [Alkalicoccus chagannorensis]
MNREQAFKWTGGLVTVDEGTQGIYIGVLDDVEAEPKKPWQGVVTIKGILQIPSLNEDMNGLQSLKYEKEESVRFPGRALARFDGEFTASYRESYAEALKYRWDIETENLEQSEYVRTIIQQELRQWQMEHVLQEESFAYYHVIQGEHGLAIHDQEQDDALSLDGCPFEFQIKSKGRWTPAYFKADSTFETKEGRSIRVSEGQEIRLNKDQFDPYKMLRNELEKPALQALERGLSRLQYSHEYHVHCHNSLLMQLLSSYDNGSFAGVNFITYGHGSSQLLVQHHYERTIHDDKEDETFDRFEFTTDQGERLITTYATTLSSDSES